MSDNPLFWRGTQSIVTRASPERIWDIWRDVAGWVQWNAGIETIELHGPFETGATFTMKPPEQDAFESTLLDVDSARGFTDETRLGDIHVVVQHFFEANGDGSTKITYVTDVIGPDAENVGGAITSDFPDVLMALKVLAESA
jgi:uncharacterized protein YndB with AHSA1/START domain